MLDVGLYIAHPVAMNTRKTVRQLLEGLPNSMHQRAMRYKREKDAYNFILGRLLLQEGLRDLKIPDTIENISFEKNGKPFLESTFFNISHTSDMVACIISKKGRIGIDIEKEEEVELENFESWFTAAEWKIIHSAPSPLRQFYWYWTRKESIIKALGLKLSYLNQIELDVNQEEFEENGKNWYLKELDLGTHIAASICSEFKLLFPINLKYISF